jgi:hypothetical protein
MASQATTQADAVLVQACNLKKGMIVCPLYRVDMAAYAELTEDADPHGGGYVNLRSADSCYSTPGSTLYVVLVS